MPDHRIESDPDLIASVVLDLALAAYPAHLSIEELVREVVGGTGSFGERDDAMNAIRDLINDGLLHRNGEFIFATRAAIRAGELAY
jgi:hypothetical protein